jgi:hypothetical protein
MGGIPPQQNFLVNFSPPKKMSAGKFFPLKKTSAGNSPAKKNVDTENLKKLYSLLENIRFTCNAL